MVPSSERHVPVLLQDAIRYLNVRAGGTYVDATLGLGGHATAIARELGGTGRFIGFDRDPDALELARGRFQALSEELGERMPPWELHGEPLHRGRQPGWVAGRLWGQLDAAGLSAQRI
jgi:16S rRNA (cytosine1402-N4)-methyltransferase